MQIVSSIDRLTTGQRRESVIPLVEVPMQEAVRQESGCQGVSLCGCNSNKRSVVDQIQGPIPQMTIDPVLQEFGRVPTDFSFQDTLLTDLITPQNSMLWKNDLVSVETDTVLSCPTGKCGQISKPVMDQKKKVSVLPNLILLGAILGTAYFVARRR